MASQVGTHLPRDYTSCDAASHGEARIDEPALLRQILERLPDPVQEAEDLLLEDLVLVLVLLLDVLDLVGEEILAEGGRLYAEPAEEALELRYVCCCPIPLARLLDELVRRQDLLRILSLELHGVGECDVKLCLLLLVLVLLLVFVLRPALVGAGRRLLVLALPLVVAGVGAAGGSVLVLVLLLVLVVAGLLVLVLVLLLVGDCRAVVVLGVASRRGTMRFPCLSPSRPPARKTPSSCSWS